MWWNMDPVDPNGNIAPLTSPRHDFPLIAGGTLKPISSMAYVDDAKRFTAMPKSEHSCNEFFNMVQVIVIFYRFIVSYKDGKECEEVYDLPI